MKNFIITVGMLFLSIASGSSLACSSDFSCGIGYKCVKASLQPTFRTPNVMNVY